MGALSGPSRTIVLSDSHGRPELITNTIEHSGYRKGLDTLVFLGDRCDIGSGTYACDRLIREYCDVVLAGNHEVAHVFHQPIGPYDPSLDGSPLPRDWYFDLMEGRMQVAYAVGNVLLTHAGIGREFVRDFVAEDPEVTAPSLAQALNSKSGSELYWKMLGQIDSSPLWFRPLSASAGMPFTGLRQVIGHTPLGYYTSNQQRKLRKFGMTLVDPYDPNHFNKPGYCVYATIEQGSDGYVVERVSTWDGKERESQRS